MKVATMARTVSLLRNIPAIFACLCLNIAHANAADGVITGEGWDKSSAVSCAKAQKWAESDAESRCRYNGGIAVRYPSGCKTEDMSKTWQGKPMFHSTYSLGAVTCNGTKEKDQQDAKALAEKGLAAKQEKEKEEKAAKARAEQELLAKQKKALEEKAARDRTERELAAKQEKEDAVKAAKGRAEKELAAKQEKEKEEKATKGRAEQELLAKQKKGLEEKAVRDRAEREIAAKQEKESAAKVAKARAEKDARAKQEERKPPERNSIDDAFAKMEKQTGKAPAARAGSIDSEFGKLEAYRAEQERLRIAADKRRPVAQAQEQELKRQQGSGASQSSSVQEVKVVVSVPAIDATKLPRQEYGEFGGFTWATLYYPGKTNVQFRDLEAYCQTAIGGQTGWRIPTMSELETLHKSGPNDWRGPGMFTFSSESEMDEDGTHKWYKGYYTGSSSKRLGGAEAVLMCVHASLASNQEFTKAHKLCKAHDC